MGLFTFPLPLRWSFFPQTLWANGVNVLLWIAGIKVEIRGLENLPKTPCLIASKHQSAWDTSIFFSILPGAAVVTKVEMLKVPVFGWFMKKLEEIPIDRSAGGAALRIMVRAAKVALSKKRSIIIFPEGTRVNIDTKKKYHPGVYALYKMLDVPVVPVALNSGYFWPSNSQIRRPGTIVLEFLPPISGKMTRDDFMKRLEQDINRTSKKLLKETGHTP